MNCEQWREALIDLLAGELDEEQAILVEQHIAECEACAEEERLLRATLNATLPPAAPSPEGIPSASLRAQVLEAFRRERSPEAARETTAATSPGHRFWRLWKRPLPTYAAASLALGALLVGLWLAGPAGLGPASVYPGGGDLGTPATRLGAESPSPDLPGDPATPLDSLGGNRLEPESFALHVPRAASLLETRFVATPSDAMAPAWAMTPDSL